MKRIAIVVLSAGLLLGACSSDDEDPEQGSSDTTDTSAAGDTAATNDDGPSATSNDGSPVDTSGSVGTLGPGATAPPGTEAGPGPDSPDGTVTVPAGSLDDLPTFDTITALRDEIVASGFTCELEYEGLEDGDKIVSICVIGGEQALLTIWNDPEVLEEFATSDAVTNLVVYGQNWTIDLTTPTLAGTVAGALNARTG